jgi:APA family basic amino acid/polyamine antiporter
MPTPARTLGIFDTTCIVIGAIVGVGIFFSPGKVAALVPTPTLILLTWAVGGFLALCGALAFAELGRRRTGPGAQYQILRDAFGPLFGFLFVFCNATAVQAGSIGIIAFICADNLFAIFTPNTPDPLFRLYLSLALIITITATNIAGVRWGSRVQNLTVICKITALLAIAALAAFMAPATPPQSGPPPEPLDPLPGVLAGLIPAFFAYGGWQHALWISGEVSNPRRTLPLGILSGTAIVVIIYLIANWAYIALLGHSGVAASKTLAADAVATIYPDIGRRIVAAAVAISAFGVLNAQLLSGPRLVSSMAADGNFFSIFARTSGKGTPVAAILLLSLCAITLVLSVGFRGIDRLLTGVVFIDGIFFALTALAFFFIKPDPDPQLQSQPHRSLPLAWLAAIIFFLGELAILIASMISGPDPKASYVGLAWLVVATIIYATFFSKRNDLQNVVGPS